MLQPNASQKEKNYNVHASKNSQGMQTDARAQQQQRPRKESEGETADRLALDAETYGGHKFDAAGFCPQHWETTHSLRTDEFAGIRCQAKEEAAFSKREKRSRGEKTKGEGAGAA